MTAFKLLSAGVIAAVMLATPAMARDSNMTARHAAANIRSRPPLARHYADGHVEIPSRHAEALPTPPDDENCDVGDNPFIC